MSTIENVNDVKNSFLSRREITCTFGGIGGKLKKLEAVEMIKKEFKLDGKTIIPISMKNHTGRPSITGTFYIYDDENLAKRHINPVIFKRLEKLKAPNETAEAPQGEKSEPKETEAKPSEEKKESKPTKEEK